MVVAKSDGGLQVRMRKVEMVMWMIWVFFGKVYASVTGLAVSAVIITVITSNGILEMIVAGIIIPTMMRVLRPVLDKLELGKSAHV